MFEERLRSFEIPHSNESFTKNSTAEKLSLCNVHSKKRIIPLSVIIFFVTCVLDCCHHRLKSFQILGSNESFTMSSALEKLSVCAEQSNYTGPGETKTYRCQPPMSAR